MVLVWKTQGAEECGLEKVTWGDTLHLYKELLKANFQKRTHYAQRKGKEEHSTKLRAEIRETKGTVSKVQR